MAKAGLLFKSEYLVVVSGSLQVASLCQTTSAPVLGLANKFQSSSCVCFWVTDNQPVRQSFAFMGVSNAFAKAIVAYTLFAHPCCDVCLQQPPRTFLIAVSFAKGCPWVESLRRLIKEPPPAAVLDDGKVGMLQRKSRQIDRFNYTVKEVRL